MKHRKVLRCMLIFGVLLSTQSPAFSAGADDLKLLISIDQPVVTAPFPARVLLHFHNAGKDTMWLYFPVRDASLVSGTAGPFRSEIPGPTATSGGSALRVHLGPTETRSNESAVEGRILESAGLPHSMLVGIPPGEDYEEKVVAQFSSISEDPGGAEPPARRFKLSATYSARYSNGANLGRILGVNIWEGETESNGIDVELRPPPAAAQGAISGSVVGTDMQPAFGAIVTLSDQQEQVVDQVLPDVNGNYRFNHLPFGFYWLAGRRRESSEDATILRHVVISAGEPAESVQLVLLQPEVYRPQQIRHKPVLFRIFGPQDQPVADVSLVATWSTGTVVENVKGRTGKDGAATLELIPGRNYLTLRKSGCPKQDERVDVAPGGGIDGFKLVFACVKR